jgi:hypothetical protein
MEIVMRKILHGLAVVVLSIGLILGMLAKGSLMGLGYASMGGVYNSAAHGVPELANWFLLLGVTWPLWAIVALALAMLAKKFPAK